MTTLHHQCVNHHLISNTKLHHWMRSVDFMRENEKPRKLIWWADHMQSNVTSIEYVGSNAIKVSPCVNSLKWQYPETTIHFISTICVHRKWNPDKPEKMEHIWHVKPYICAIWQCNLCWRKDTEKSVIWTEIMSVKTRNINVLWFCFINTSRGFFY